MISGGSKPVTKMGWKGELRKRNPIRNMRDTRGQHLETWNLQKSRNSRMSKI